MDVIAAAIDSGRYTSEEDVVSEGLRLLAEKERRFQELKDSIDAAIEEGGEYTSDEVLAHVEERLAAWEARLVAE
jgi:putative addiction module CopG family antidote